MLALPDGGAPSGQLSQSIPGVPGAGRAPTEEGRAGEVEAGAPGAPGSLAEEEGGEGGAVHERADTQGAGGCWGCRQGHMAMVIMTLLADPHTQVSVCG